MSLYNIIVYTYVYLHIQPAHNYGIDFDGLISVGLVVRVASQQDLHSFLHAATIKSLFDGKVKFSEDGSNMKAKGMATYMFFADYLEDCAGLYLLLYIFTAYVQWHIHACACNRLTSEIALSI